MPTAGIKVLTVGHPFKLPYEVKHLDGASGLVGAIATFRPDVIVTSSFIPGVLNNFAFEWRKRWIHVDPKAKSEDVSSQVEGCYSFNIWGVSENQKYNPLVSVYTGTKNTGDHLREAYQSLLDQTYTNWEWVVIDDASTDETWKRLCAASEEDPRIRPYRSAVPIGKIGAVKDQATRLSRGEYLVELDHDDILVDTALAELVKAFQGNPDVGFIYSNSSNFLESGGFQRFNDDFWKNRYRDTEYRGKKWLECLNPNIYDRFGPNYWDQFGYFLTVGPNHVRAFRASTFRELGGYNPNLPVADDWDLYARFFLQSKCLHLDRMLYLYRIKDNWGNTTFTRNKSIQDHLALGRNHYFREFDAFNKKRLAPKSGGGEILLTVAVPAIPSRMKTSLVSVLEELFAQAEGKPVEISCFLDNKARNLSEKRNSMIAAAKGKFIAFVDDDDEVDPDYVDALLQAIRFNQDAHCVVFDVMVHGYDPEPKLCKYGIEYKDQNAADAYYRLPNHVMAYRTEISRRHLYRKDRSGINEDFEWAVRASKDVVQQTRVKKVLYHYKYDPKQTTQKGTQRQRGATDVSYVILQATQHPAIVRCLESVRAWSPGSEIILVANGVEPDPKLQELSDQVVLLEKNLGFAAGANLGATEATRELVCFLNDDAAFVDQTPFKLIEAVGDDSPIVAPYCNRAKPPQGDIPREQTPSGDTWPDMVTGLCLMMEKSKFFDLGGFDTRLLTWEDDDLCLKAARRGWKSRIVGGTWVDHERHSTFKALGLDPNAVIAENRLKYQTLHPRIRVVAIAKDEAGPIEGFFRQFEKVTRDWCLLDTGSTDRTREIARDIGVRIESGPFENFCDARNLALQRFREGADWIIMMDPDERLDAHAIEHLEALLSKTSADILLAPLDAVYPDGARKAFVPKAFAFRALPQILWVFKVHEKVIGSKRQAMVKNALIEHVISLHDQERRGKSSGLYERLMKEEPYFTDPSYKARWTQEWPILDYDHMDDDRIAKIHCGPLVSTVIATYDRKELLEKAIASAFAQDYPNLEVVVIGDACPSLKIENPAVRWINLPKNHGAGGAVPRNYGIMFASAELIAYLDDDNEWAPDHISSLYAALRSTDSAYAFSSMRTLGKDLIFQGPKRGSIDTSCVLHKKSLIRKYGWWKDRIQAGYAHDWEFFSRWASERWAATEKPTLLYNAETSGQLDFLKQLVAQ
jgi:glycosyltransferase involved in cell wall biosynthesis